MPASTAETKNLYRHFKGGLYVLLGHGRHSETQEPMVIYVALSSGEVWVRPLALWEEIVVWSDGQSRPRFIKESS